MLDEKEKVFIVQNITNEDIYQEILDLKDSVETTNDKATLNRLMIQGIWTSLGVVTGAIVWVANKIFNLR